MAQGVVWSHRALLDLEAIANYIGSDSPAYAGVVIKSIIRQTKMLGRFPRRGRRVPEFDDEDLREVFAYSYRLQRDEIIIAAVIHGKRILQ